MKLDRPDLIPSSSLNFDSVDFEDEKEVLQRVTTTHRDFFSDLNHNLSIKFLNRKYWHEYINDSQQVMLLYEFLAE